MPEKVELREWLSYEPIWLIIGLILAVLLIGWYALVFWLTRRRPQRSLNTLQAKPFGPPDLTMLKQKYLQLIDQAAADYQARKISARETHQNLSYLLRMFVYEIRGHRVDTLTLKDLKMTRYQALTAAIEEYYLPEFAKVEQGSVDSAVVLARKVVSEWN